MAARLDVRDTSMACVGDVSRGGAGGRVDRGGGGCPGGGFKRSADMKAHHHSHGHVPLVFAIAGVIIVVGCLLPCSAGGVRCRHAAT